jgi:hypothetical protein
VALRTEKPEQESLALEGAEFGLSTAEIQEIGNVVAKEGQVVWQFFKSKEPGHVGVCTVAYESLFAEGDFLGGIGQLWHRVDGHWEVDSTQAIFGFDVLRSRCISRLQEVRANKPLPTPANVTPAAGAPGAAGHY